MNEKSLKDGLGATPGQTRLKFSDNVLVVMGDLEIYRVVYGVVAPLVVQ